MRRLAGVLLVLAAAPAAALADGGSSVDSAPVLPFDSPQAGDHRNGLQVAPESSPFGCPEFHSLWTIDARQGDRIVVQWGSEHADVKMKILPAGTTDATVPTVASLVDSTLNRERTATSIFQPTRSGRYPLDFYAVDCPGVSDDPFAYDFTASVQRRARLTLPKVGRLDRRGRLRVRLRSPDGRALAAGSRLRVRLQLTTPRGGFRTIGTATGAGRALRVRYAVPANLRDRRGRLRALATGAGYVRSVSVERALDVR